MPPRAPLQAAASAARPNGADRRQIFRDNSRCSGPWAAGQDFPSRCEVRVVGDEERAIVNALNALRPRYTYVFTTGGIGPTHGDITADCVAKSFGVPIDTDPRALAILHEWVKTTGAEMMAMMAWLAKF